MGKFHLSRTTKTDPQPFPNAAAPFTPRPDITMNPFMSPSTSWGLFKELYSADNGNTCWCKTFAIVGDSSTASQFQTFIQSEYNALKAYYASKNQFFTNPDFTPGFTPGADSQITWVQCPSNNTDTFFRIFPTVSDLNAFVSTEDYGDVSVDRQPSSTATDRLCGAVVFPANALSITNPQIHLRFNLTWNRPAVYSSYLTKTNLADDTRGLLAGSESPRRWYMEQGFVGMQILVQKFLRKTHTLLRFSTLQGSNLETIEQTTSWDIYPFPTSEYSENEGLEFVINFSFYLVLCFAFTVTLTIGRIVREREQKIREYMRIMGMYDSAYYVSWILYSMIIWAIVAAGITGMWYVFAFRVSNFGWIFLFNFMFGLASSSFAFFISSLVTKERLGSVIGFFIYTILQFAVPPTYSDPIKYYAFSLMPPSAYVMGVRTIFTLESMNVGVTNNSINRTVYGYSLQIGFTMLAVDIVLWWILYYYIEQVNPFLVGYKRKWYFPLSPSYWNELCCSCSRRRKKRDESNSHTLVSQEGDDGEENVKVQKTTDPELLRLEAENRVIKTSNLTKKFGSNFYAVNNLSLTMYANEIYCLLGHNGAGKTTTFSMLSGLLEQTDGHITVFGSRVPEDMANLRKSMGVCPQHSSHWDELSAFEHLEIFAGLRGLNWRSISVHSQLQGLIVEVGLGNRKNFQVKALSGGMKRKLSVGIAFVGDPQVVFLDEPTSGMDPFARRSTWDLLKRKRNKDRVICLTTHYMDEADVLGDRIAIMSHGKLECMGSSMFLKKIYGCGYMLSFMMENGGVEGKNLYNHIKASLSDRKNAKMISNVGKEVIVEVDGDDPQFVSLVESLDTQTNRNELHIKSFGVSVPNIEEVFLKVSGGEDLMNRENTSSSGGDQQEITNSSPEKKRSVSFWTQFLALIERRIRFSIRDRYFFFMQLLFPFFILVVGLALAKNSLDQTPTPITLDVAPLNPDISNGNIWQAGGMSSGDSILGNIENYCQIGNTTLSSTECNFLVTPIDSSTTPYGFQTALLHSSGWPYSPNPFFAYESYSDSSVPGNPEIFGVWQNTTGLHTAALAPLGYFNAWASRASQTPVQVTIVNDPLPNTLWEISAINAITGLVATQVILLALRFIPTAVIAFILLEKEKEIKEQLYISGVAVKSYWLSHFVFDSIASGLASLITIATFYIFSLDAFTNTQTLPGSFALLLLYAPAATAFAYFCSFFFSTQTSGQSFIALMSLILGNILLVIAFVLQLLPTSTCESCYNVGVTLVWIGRFFPVFALGSGFYALSNYVEQFDLPLTSSKLFGGCKNGYYFGRTDCFAGIGDDLFFLGATAIGYLILALIIDRIRSTPKWQKALVVKPPKSSLSTRQQQAAIADEDEAVLAEKQRVDVLNPSSQMLVVNRIMKLFRRAGTFWRRLFGAKDTIVFAVDEVSFASNKGEVFGLLGNNGAGKTTTFKMLCGLYCPSSGTIHVDGLDSSDHMMQVRKIIGYCAQFDAQWDLLTTREHVLLYAKLRGYKGKELTEVVETKIDEMNLREYASVRSGALSGGNRRKLSVAMALVGEPELVFLDEPSCGMDPFARRNMWKIIESVTDKRKHAVIILTTHSMEEAEALCSRIAIQVDGKFRCLGTSQEIKHRYGEGHTLSIRVVTPVESGNGGNLRVETVLESICNGLQVTASSKVSIDACKRFVADNLGRSQRLAHPTFGLKDEEVSVSDFANWIYRDQIFGKMESFMISEFPGEGVLEVIEIHGLNMVLKINGSIKIGELFRKLSDNKSKVGMEDYQITQTTLEQIFNRFAATATRRED